ncbi:zonular occludens toxin domain-containing protein [Stutzerimonas stutzeri]|uniref:zonular occludens toxin domain-containing protein n=1 Tax=Stutzerimonas stutzeri TaxID=316 RepID=UPI001480835F|nr:zonular occludens toxin domain-containing protein [Stutzerimonas stutzeri]WRQ05058.1 zonular occludens toxin domain-containing protein [Stutzerimonas stutzeri]WRQ05067.1 zonular occludens toxin domain-containing protein [Stutzerimonas stutzeri]
MITLITAVPGSGKTLYCIGLILKAVEEGRPVYSNIAGLKIPQCHPAPDDWRDTPEGSLVVYDEAQQPHLYPSTAHRGEVKDERLRQMEVHRHTGHDLVFVSQSPSFLHHHIRKLAGEHIHLYRAFGAKIVTKYTWQHTVDSPNDRGEQGRADSVPWKFPKEHFQYYQSATIHTHKFKMPKKLAALLIFIVVVAGLVVWNASTNQNSLLTGSGADIHQPVASATAAPSEPGGVRAAATTGQKKALPATTTLYDWSETETAKPVAGCIYNATRCQCFDASGSLYAMAHAQCLSVATNMLPRSINVGGSSRGSSRQGMVSGESQQSLIGANPFAEAATPAPGVL